MKKNQFETIFYSAAGVVALILILIAFNFIAGRAKQRIDLTAEKSFTLSDGTKAILKQLDTKVKIRFYYSQGENSMPVPIENLRATHRRFASGISPGG